MASPPAWIYCSFSDGSTDILFFMRDEYLSSPFQYYRRGTLNNRILAGVNNNNAGIKCHYTRYF